MLAGVLHTDVAVKTSIQIMNAFVAMRHYLGDNLNRISNIETKVKDLGNKCFGINKIIEKYILKSLLSKITV